jgi:hypothetical protein
VTRIDVSLDEFTYTFTTVTKDNKTTFCYNDEEISIDDFNSALTALSADSFTEAVNSIVLNKNSSNK